MLKESLNDTLAAAKYCVEYRKTREEWQENSGGCLSYPAAILLLSIIDAIGSYFKGDNTFKIKIDEKIESINSKGGWQHFKILNSKYFNQELSQEFIKKLYKSFRSFLVHNSVIGKYSVIVMNNQAFKNGTKDQAFLTINHISGEVVYIISLYELYELCYSAVQEFLKDADKVVPKSRQGKSFH